MELLNEFGKYAEEQREAKGLKTIDKWVFIKLFKVFVDFINDCGYLLVYVGKKAKKRQIEKGALKDGIREQV